MLIVLGVSALFIFSLINSNSIMLPEASVDTKRQESKVLEFEKRCVRECCVQAKVQQGRIESKLAKVRAGEPRDEVERDKISISSLKAKPDFLYGTLPKAEGFNFRMWDRRYIPCLTDGIAIYVESSDARRWFESEHPLFKQKYVLVTGDSDTGAGSIADALAQVKDKRILHWFSHNCDFPANHPMFQNGLLTCYPIGLSQWMVSGKYQTDVIDHFHRLHPQIPVNGWQNFKLLESAGLKTSPKLVIGTFNPSTNRGVREPIRDRVVSGDWKQFADFVNGKSVEDLYETIATYKFGLSPFGNGVDCYRTYELLFLGVIPIVKDSALNAAYHGLPVLILESWDKLTPELLESTWSDFTSRSFDSSVLYQAYWESRFASYRNWTFPDQQLNFSLKVESAVQDEPKA